MIDRDHDTFEAFAVRFAAVEALVPARPAMRPRGTRRSIATFAAAAAAVFVLVVGGAVGSRLLSTGPVATASHDASVVALASPPASSLVTPPSQSHAPPSEIVLAPLDPARPVETLRPPCYSHYAIVDRMVTTPAQDAAGSTSVVIARATAVGAAQWNAPDGRPRDQWAVGPFDVMRLVRLEVETTIHGAVQPEVITVWVPGGTIGCDEFRLSGIPDLAPGGRYVVFLNATATRTAQAGVVGAWQLWSISGDSVGTPQVGPVPLDELITQIRAGPRSSSTP